MELDENGRVRETFQNDCPYELSCGALLDDGCVHFCRILVCFTGRPFIEVGPVLQEEMEKALSTLEEWDAKFLRKHGEREDLDNKESH